MAGQLGFDTGPNFFFEQPEEPPMRLFSKVSSSLRNLYGGNDLGPQHM